jgi:toxin ParE1/3/4
MSYRLSPKATADLEAIGDYIALHSPQAAAAFITRLHERWSLLATQPRSGAGSNVIPGVRHIVVGKYVAFYRVEGDDVLVLRVIHGHRDIEDEDVE